MVSRDIDFLGGAADLQRAGELFGGRVRVAGWEDHTPLVGAAMFLDSDGHKRRLDFLEGAAAQGRTGVTFKDVAEGWYASGKLKRDWSSSTQRDYRSVLDHHLIETFGALRIESVSSPRIERWRDGQVQDHGMSRRNANKLLAILHGIFEYAVRKHGLLHNPACDGKS